MSPKIYSPKPLPKNPQLSIHAAFARAFGVDFFEAFFAPAVALVRARLVDFLAAFLEVFFAPFFAVVFFVPAFLLLVFFPLAFFADGVVFLASALAVLVDFDSRSSLEVPNTVFTTRLIKDGCSSSSGTGAPCLFFSAAI